MTLHAKNYQRENLSCTHFKQNTLLVSETYNRKKVVLNENFQMQSENVMIRQLSPNIRISTQSTQKYKVNANKYEWLADRTIIIVGYICTNFQKQLDNLDGNSKETEDLSTFVSGIISVHRMTTSQEGKTRESKNTTGLNQKQ